VNVHVVINAVLLQATWFAAVLGGTRAALVACLVLAAHVLARSGWRDLTLGAVVGALGLGLDTLWIYSGILDYHGAVLAPPWIVVLWVAVGLSLNHSLSMFIRHPWTGAALVAVSGPLSYMGGAALGAVVIPAPPLLVAVALGWALLFGGLFGVVAPFFNRQFEEIT
jgi:hypothetical protein